MSVDSAAAKGQRRKELCLSQETWPMTSWQQSPFSRMNGPWSRSTSSCRTLTSIICHGGVFSLYMSSYALLKREQLWLLFAPMRQGWWSTLLSFLVNGLSPLWSQLGKLPSSGTRNYFFSTKRIIGSGPSGKTFTLLPHWTVSRAEIDHPSALFDVFARMLGPGVRLCPHLDDSGTSPTCTTPSQQRYSTENKRLG